MGLSRERPNKSLPSKKASSRGISSLGSLSYSQAQLGHPGLETQTLHVKPFLYMSTNSYIPLPPPGRQPGHNALFTPQIHFEVTHLFGQSSECVGKEERKMNSLQYEEGDNLEMKMQEAHFKQESWHVVKTEILQLPSHILEWCY